MTKRSMYPFHSSVSRRQRLTEGVSEAWCFKKYLNVDSIIYTVMYIPLVQNDGSLISEWHKYIHGLILRHSKIPFFFFFSSVSCLNKLFLDLLFFTWLGGSDAGWGGWSCGMCVWLVTDEWTDTWSARHHYPRVDSSETTRAMTVASALRFRHALRQAWARARAHTRHTPDVCAHSFHLDRLCTRGKKTI